MDADLRKVLLDNQHAGFPPYSSLSPVELRKKFNHSFAKKPTPPEISMKKVVEKVISTVHGECKLRLYYPVHSTSMPALMYFHGGGFVIRDQMEVYDYTCRLIAKRTGCVVIAVDFRLAPEHPFPAAPEDCYTATCWVSQHGHELGIDRHRLGVWGESCGGNLAAVVALMARDRGGPDLLCQVLVSPMLGLNFNTDSYQKYQTGFVLTRDTMQWFWRHYLSREEDKHNPYAIPLQAANLSGLPHAMVVTTEHDVLRDDGVVYADRLRDDGTKTDYHCYPKLIHGFFDLYDKVMAAKLACDDILRCTKALILGK